MCECQGPVAWARLRITSHVPLYELWISSSDGAPASPDHGYFHDACSVYIMKCMRIGVQRARIVCINRKSIDAIEAVMVLFNGERGHSSGFWVVQ